MGFTAHSPPDDARQGQLAVNFGMFSVVKMREALQKYADAGASLNSPALMAHKDGKMLDDQARIVRDAYAGMADLYETLVVPKVGYLARAEEFLRRRFEPGMRVLDLGCGTGVATRWLPDGAVVGLDLSPEMLAKAQAARPEHLFAVHDFHDPVPAQFGLFDLLICVGAFEFCKDLPAVSVNIAQTLVSGGLAFLTPVHRDPGAPEGEAMAPSRFPGMLAYSYLPAQVEEAFSKAGLKKISRELGSGWSSDARQFVYEFWEVSRG